MSDEAKLTQADIDKAVAAAVEKATGPLSEKLEAAEAKNAGLLDDLKKAQREARAAKDITPEAHQAEVERADKAEGALAEANKQVKTLTTERDAAKKALETEQTVSRSYALENEINLAIAAGGVVPQAVAPLRALGKEQAKVDVVDGKIVVSIGDKPASEFYKGYLESEDGKVFKAALANGGGGAPGGGGSGGGAKTVTRQQFDAMSHPERSAFAKDGGKVVETA